MGRYFCFWPKTISKNKRLLSFEVVVSIIRVGLFVVHFLHLGESRKGERNEKKEFNEKVKRDHVVGNVIDHDCFFVRGAS